MARQTIQDDWHNPLAYVDPNGKEKFKVTLTVYIPGHTINDPFGRIYNSNGNGRGDTPLDSKAKHFVTVETDQKKAAIHSWTKAAGSLGRYDMTRMEI